VGLGGMNGISLCIFLFRCQRQQTNNISIAISFGFQNFSENSLSACAKQNKL
jgi:hypothetical protein